MSIEAKQFVAQEAVPNRSKRALFSWLVDPIEESEQHIVSPNFYDEPAFLDRLCFSLYDLPSMRGLVSKSPKLSETPIQAVYEEKGPRGSYKRSDGIKLNFQPRQDEGKDTLFSKHIVILPHEYRHGYQDQQGCLSVRLDPYLCKYLRLQLAHNRVIEADSNAFSLTVAYEAATFLGKTDVLEAARKVAPSAAAAFEKAINEDKNSHWDGRAAQAAYEAYFHKDNLGTLEIYDLKRCEEFKWNMRAVRPAPDELPKEQLIERLYKMMKPIVSMPYVTDDGEVVERKAYNPEGHCYGRSIDTISKTLFNTVQSTPELSCHY